MEINNSLLESNLIKESTLNAEQWMTFKMGGEVYAISVLAVKEVLRCPLITPVPHSPNFVLGLINLRGNVVTVIDGRKRLDLQEKELLPETRVVIVESGEHVVGILVDSVREVISIEKNQIEQPPSIGDKNSHDFIQGIYYNKKDLFILLNEQAFLCKN